jgi:hypothetical protein
MIMRQSEEDDNDDETKGIDAVSIAVLHELLKRMVVWLF